jgi:hypothetical protein
MRGRAYLVLVIVALPFAIPVRAEERGYVGGGLTVSTWGPRESPERSASLRELNSTGATVPGVFAEAGIALRPAFVIGIEVGVPARRHEWTQTSHYVVSPGQTNTRYRDLTFAAVTRLQTPETGVFRAGLVGGVELVLQDSLQRSARGHVGPNGQITFDPFGDQLRVTGWTTGAVIGGDASIAITERLAIVPEARLHLISREGVLASSIGRLNVAGVVFRAGVGVRARF